MARAIVRSLLPSSKWPIKQDGCSIDKIIGVGRSESSCDAFLALAPGSNQLSWTSSIEEAAQEAAVILLAIKPQQMEGVLHKLQAVYSQKIQKNGLWISIAAGIPLCHIESGAPQGVRVIRAMPNTPIALGYGATALVSGRQATAEDRYFCEALFGMGGKIYWIEEKQIDIATALIGSGPAYFYLLTQVLTEAATQAGIDRTLALHMASATARGAAEMLCQTNLTPDELIAQVASKGGTTEAALSELDQSDWSKICHRAFEAALRRAEKLTRDTS